MGLVGWEGHRARLGGPGGPPNPGAALGPADEWCLGALRLPRRALPAQMSEVAPPGGPPIEVKGKYEIAQLPGSEVVYDRDIMDMRPCTAELCPCGLDNRTEQIVLQEVSGSCGCGGAAASHCRANGTGGGAAGRW
jgi:hypothetical protein